MMSKDVAKLGLLVSAFFACMLSLLFNYTTDVPSASILSAPLGKFCRKQASLHETCLQVKGAPCDKTAESLSRCKFVIEQAYRRINLGGCIHSIRKHDICRFEFCIDSRQRNCEECKDSLDVLNLCIESIISDYSQRAGIEIASK